MTDLKNLESLAAHPESDKAVKEGAGFVESSEFHDRVERALPSEVASENPSENIGGAGGAQYSGATNSSEASSNVSIGAIPSEKVMKKEVVRSIEKEIVSLKKEVKRMSWPFSKFDADKYQQLVCKIRALGHVLSELAYATYEQVKGFWLKYVKNS